MRHARVRQLDRLEKLAQPYLKERQKARVQIRREWQLLGDLAVAHAAVVAFTSRYGKPQRGEPLSRAFQRCTESSAWQKCCDRSTCTRRNESFKPDGRNRLYPYDQVFTLGFPVRHAVIKALSGADEKEKLSAAFASTPPWLIWFTFADYTAALLNLTLPDLSSVTGLARSKENFPGWYGLPNGAFE